MAFRFAVCWPPSVVLVMMLFVYGIYMFNMMSAIDIIPNPAILWTVLGVFHAFFFMLLVAFLRAMMTSPGTIPADSRMWTNAEFGIRMSDEERVRELMNPNSGFVGAKLEAQKNFLKSLPVVERKQKNGSFRYCSRCELYKPDRTHHCRVCDHCVLRMDHHCPWIANCVGFFNYKYFALLLFYASLCLVTILVTMFPRLLSAFRPMLDADVFMTQDVPVVVAYAFCLFLFMALGVFMSFHLNMVMNSLTTIELREKKNSDNEYIRHRFNVAHLKFDQGSRYKNFVHVFGSPWMWLLPIQSNNLGNDGTYTVVSESRAKRSDYV